MCMGRHYTTTSAAAQAAQPEPVAAYSDPDCVSSQLAGRHKVGAGRLGAWRGWRGSHAAAALLL